MKALLDQLRASQAWQELLDEPQPDPNNIPHATGSTPLPPRLELEPELEPVPEPSPPLSNHISSLLSRLQPGGGEASSLGTSHSRPSLGATHYGSRPGPPLVSCVKHHTPTVNGLTAMPIGPPPQATAPRQLNFNQSLPVISRLSEDPVFMTKLAKVSR